MKYKFTIIIICIILIFLFLVYKYKCMNQNVEGFVGKLSSVVIIGTARNIDKYLAVTINKIKTIMGLFSESYVIIYENDSTDRTLEILHKFQASTPNVRIISEKNVPGLRTQRLSYGRNLLMNEALKMKTEYIVIMDLDDVNSKLTATSFLTSFEYKDLDWAVMTANQNDKYYDLWALLTYDNWMPFDCWECTKHDTVDNCVNSRFKKIGTDNELILVKSAFGGLGIYKTKYLKPTYKYDGGSGTQELCEHVTFNKAITKDGGKIYINPKMINN